MHILNPLAKLRQSAGFPTAASAASNLGVSTIHLIKVEGGHAGASGRLLGAMAELYRAPADAVAKAYRSRRRSLLKRQLSAA